LICAGLGLAAERSDHTELPRSFPLWLADVEAIVAARKRKSRYRDVLTKPIQLKRPELGLWLHKDEIRRQAERAWLERFDSLRSYYGIRPGDPEHWKKLALCLIADHERGKLGVFLKRYGSEVKDPKYWQGLAICLACDHVPGLKMLPPKPGRPPNWNIGRAREFVRITDDLKKNWNLKSATSKAAKTMGLSLAPGSPQNLYRRSKRMIQQRRLASPRLDRGDES
jgi:hypothetical protein